ncbi:hypothetical protein L596_005444 [Steinernema carpocapsae]|uniref:Uncharacterized protein n=1 Tax=Steinernema carpocapsae TaxID=34508 RepID=A0A4U8UZA3_STECR|nr:hypothetical protein L596_005444 [Steinernema carpocapsae]
MVSDSPGVPLLAAEEDGQHLRVPREDGQRHVQFKIGEAGAGCSPPGSPTADLNILQELLSTRVNYVNGMVMEGPNGQDKRYSYSSTNSVNSMDSAYGNDHRKHSQINPTRVSSILMDGHRSPVSGADRAVRPEVERRVEQ